MEKEKSKKTRNKKKKPSKMDKELYWVLGIMLALILVFLVSSSVFQSLKTFEFQGLSFTKEKLGDIQLYKHSYSFSDPRPITGSVVSEPRQFNLFLRNDPRENNVPIEGEEIVFVMGTTAFISVNGTGLTQCEYSSVAISNLASFLTVNLISVKGATPDEELARETNLTHASCDTTPVRQVVLIQSGDETKIEVKNTRCYIITVANCEILSAIEKFTIQSIIDARARQSPF